ncbi:MAG: serine--tRNA ligase [Alphaproteobacteria bacterium]|nr:serine--tRNA ligase [Alphaproteobacteria bacterium]
MFDIKWIRDNPEAFDASLKKRGMAPAADELIALDKSRRAAQTALQDMQRRRNEASQAIGAAKSRGEDAAAQMAEVQSLKEAFQKLEQDERDHGEALNTALAAHPNRPAEDVPEGTDEADNVEVRRWGAKPELAGEARQHFELGEALALMDFKRAAKISGARFVVLSGALARLERALAGFMLDQHTEEFGYTEVAPPILVREDAAFGTGNLPKFAEDLFKTVDDYWLIPTAEMPLTNLVAGEILEAADLPLRFTAYTPCFRAEAGSAGKDTRGMIRQHQFGKVEMVSIAHPEQSNEEHERMTNCAEEVLRRLDLHYRTVVLSTGDLGFSARKTYDIEVWLPGQDSFREISSCSNCGDFQARRMNARFRPGDAKGTRFVHTLNGSGLAVGRTLIAILENYQNADGSISVPEILRPRMGGLERIG